MYRSRVPSRRAKEATAPSAAGLDRRDHCNEEEHEVRKNEDQDEA
jgi:hypothetical protein